MDDFSELLSEMFRTEYVNAAFVIDRDGYIVTQRMRRLTVDRATLALQTLAVSGAIKCFGSQTGLGTNQQIMLEFQGAVVMMAPFAAEYMLVVIAAPSVTLGLFRTLFSGFLQRFSKQMLASTNS